LKTILTVHKQAELCNPPAEIREKIKQVCTLPNPDFVQAEKYGRWTGGIEPELFFYEETGDSITFLRGYARQVASQLKQAGVGFAIEDRRRELEPLPLEFRGKLRDYQQAAVDAAMQRDHGTIEAPTGSGKTAMALYLIARRRQPALVLVHNLELAHQWIERARQFLGIEAGLCGDSRREIRQLTIATHQTARKHLGELPRHFGFLVADEVHRAPALSYSEVIQAFDARYLLGLTATGYRRDGLGRLIYLLMGDRVYKVDRGALERSGAIVRPEVVTRETSFEYFYNDDYPAMIEALTLDQARNRQIVDDIKQSTNGGAALIVSDRINHLEALAGMLNADRQAILTGRTPKAERQAIVDDLGRGEIKVLFSTMALISEGFDCPGLSTLFIASPIKFKGRLIQTVGRILRPAEGKQAVIYDYQDTNQPVLAAAARARTWALAEIAGRNPADGGR